MRMGILGLALFACVGCASPNATMEAAPDTLNVLEDCPADEPTCVWFYAYFNSDYAAKKFSSFEHLPSPQYAMVKVRVKGRLNGGPARLYTLTFLYYTHTIGCYDLIFPTVGIKDSLRGLGTILTTKGRFETVKTPFQLGSMNTVTVFDMANKTSRHFLTPSQFVDPIFGDPTIWGGNGRFTPEGQLLWFDERRGNCLRLDDGALIKQVPTQDCFSTAPRRAHYQEAEQLRTDFPSLTPEMSKRLQFDLMKIENTPFFTNVSNVACRVNPPSKLLKIFQSSAQ